MITAHQLTKSFRVHHRAPGLVSSVMSVLTRSHRWLVAVDAVSFEIEPGRIVGLLGANGAGKTTLLKMICGLLHPTSGRLQVWGTTPSHRATRSLCRIGFVMGHKQQLDWDLTPADTLRVHRAIYGIDSTAYAERLERWSELVDLDEVLHRPVRTLSLGQRMACELLAALLHDPALIVLDEPTLGLDVPAQRALRRLVAAHAERTNATVLLASHHLPDVVALADRVMVMDQGSLVFDDTLQVLQRDVGGRSVITVRTEARAPSQAFERYGQARRCDDDRVELLVDHADVPAVTRAILEQFEITELSVGPVPVEDVVAQLLGAGSNP
ncbi:MAG: ATP-binding cassette domain-containing protein [Myxococcales bacterium]|nr:ATP-binding cassette domain-containing protein [Myxococcales bacterium]